MQVPGIDVNFIASFSRFCEDVRSVKTRLNNIVLLAALLNKKSPNIVLADDDLGSREIFIEAIREIAPHIEVNLAINGKKLMDLLYAQIDSPPDIIFLDLNMPLKDGRECLKEIRNDTRLKNIPIIIFSTSSNEHHIDQTYQEGANFYLIKPDSFNDLKIIAKNILSLDWVTPIWPERERFVLVPIPLK